MIRIELRGPQGVVRLANPSARQPALRMLHDRSLAGGVILEGENEPPPRVASAILQPRLAEWSRLPSQPVLVGRVDDGALVIDSDPPGGIPMGRYALRLSIADVVDTRQPVELVLDGGDSSASACLDVHLRSIEIFERLDAQIERACARSSVDGLAVDVWLRSPLVQARRKACLLNVLGVLRAHGFDGRYVANDEEPSLVTLLGIMQQVYVDRIVALVDRALDARLGTAPDSAVARDDQIHASHKGSLQRFSEALGWDWRRLRLHGFRFRSEPSMQVILAIPPSGDFALGEIDIDRANPKNDLVSALRHVLELFDDGIDHIELFPQLAQRADGRYIAYRPV